MTKSFITAALAGVFAFGLTTAAFAKTGEFNNMCAEGLAMHKKIETDCAINGEVEGKTYCFGSEQAKADFMKNPKVNLKKAQTFYSKNQANPAGLRPIGKGRCRRFVPGGLRKGPPRAGPSRLFRCGVCGKTGATSGPTSSATISLGREP
ncbi:hypothetical protein [Methyloceanibacter superfactus]|nr:hypothetical protein [Methyloceanibacter superfactus]